MLEAAGIGAGEERVYRFLVGLREADAAVIADRLGMEVAEVQRELASLHDKGLVGPVAASTAGGAVRYVPVAPDTALRPLLLRGHEALESARRGWSSSPRSTGQVGGGMTRGSSSRSSRGRA